MNIEAGHSSIRQIDRKSTDWNGQQHAELYRRQSLIYNDNNSEESARNVSTQVCMHVFIARNE